MTILWEEMVFLTNSAYGEESVEETIEMDATNVTSNTAIEIDLNIVIAPFFFFSLRCQLRTMITCKIKPPRQSQLKQHKSEKLIIQATITQI